MTNVLATRRSEQGFTLVELAIVMVIIGLLIGGILKGQELIANARTSSTVSQVKGLDAALNTFQDKYNGLAGDILAPNTRLPNCAGPCNTAGNANGIYGNVAGALPAVANEGVVAFPQLNAADLVQGIDVTGANVAFGYLLPAAKAGGGMWLGSSDAAGNATAIAGTLNPNRNYVALNGQVAAVAAGTGGFPVTVAAQIDRKLDDGIANTGTTQAVCGAGGIVAGAYQENIQVPCALYSRVLN